MISGVINWLSICMWEMAQFLVELKGFPFKYCVERFLPIEYYIPPYVDFGS